MAVSDLFRSRRIRVVAFVIILAGIAVPSWAAISRFDDVPDSNTFVNDIEWIADAGITNGCGTDVYCPDRDVTRAQMAGFLHRLAINQVVDAGTLAGLAPASYETFVFGDVTAMGDQSNFGLAKSGVPFVLAESSFDTLAPDSAASITASASFDTGDGTALWVWLEVDLPDTATPCADYIQADPGAFRRADINVGKHEEVSVAHTVELPTQGTHTVTFCVQIAAPNTAYVLSAGLTGVVSASPANSVTSEIIPP